VAALPSLTRRATIAVLLSLCFLSTAAAQEITLENVTVGFNGRYKVGVWSPVSVTLSGPRLRGRLELRTPDGDDVDTVVSRDNVQIDGQPKQLLVRFGSTDATLTVVFRPEGAKALRWELASSDTPDERHIPRPLETSHELLVEIGRGVGLRGVRDSNRARRGEEIVTAQLDQRTQLQQLPTEWFGYEGVDALFLSTSQELDLESGRLLSTLAADNARWQALAQWVRSGGRLIVGGGGAADQLANVLRRTGPVGELMPGRLAGDASLDRLSALEQYAATTQKGAATASAPLEIPLADPSDPGSARRLRVAQLSEVEGAVELAQDGVPLVVRAPRGFGEVVFVALDLDRAPLAHWPGRTALLNRLLGKPAEGTQAPPEDDESSPQQMLLLGVTDLAGQLKGALDQFAGIRPVSFVLVAGLALLYIALIGPLDYVLVRKVFRRPELTWVTFPLMVLVFSLATYQLAYWMKGKQLLVNQVDLVDVDLSSGQVRGQTWFNVFSPDSRSFDVSVTPLPAVSDGKRPNGSDAVPENDGQPAESASVVSWLGLPGEALGGMDRSGSPGLFQGSYAFTASGGPEEKGMTMTGVPIPVWSSKSFTARWTKAAPDAAVRCDLRWESGRLRGTIRNNMDIPLSDCLLVYRGPGSGTRSAHVIRFATIEAGKSATISPTQSPDDLGSHIRGFRYVGQSGGSGAIAGRARDYNPLATDVPGILRQMTFYHLIDGRSYTRLLHRYQGHVDLSHLLNDKLSPKRAILMGFAQQPAAEVRLGDEAREEQPHDKHWTCYRFIAQIGE